MRDTDVQARERVQGVVPDPPARRHRPLRTAARLAAFACVLISSPLVSAQEASARIHERAVSLAGGYSVEAGGSDAKHRLTFHRLRTAESSGDPLVPELLFEIALPHDETVRAVDVIPTSERSLAGLDGSALTGSYAAAAVTSGFRDGYRIVSLRVRPLRLDPHGAGAQLAEQFVLHIDTVPVDGPSEALVRRKAPSSSGAERDRRVARSVDWVLDTPSRGLETPRGEALRVSRAPSLEDSGVDLVVVCPAAFEASFDDFVAWKTATGTRTVVRTVEWIAATYEAPDLIARVREFLRDAYVHWGIEYAILAGDTDVLPIRHAISRYNAPDGAEVACDYYMACLDGDWNANGNHLVGEGPRTGIVDDEADLQPDIYVGRWPVSTAAEASTIANKTMWYRGADAAHFDSGYQTTVSFYAEALAWNPPGAHEWEGVCDDIVVDGATMADSVYSAFLPPEFQATTNLFYESQNCWGSAPYVPVPEDRAAVIADFNSGRHFVVHIGHGFRNNMAVGAADQKLFNGDAETFTNGDRTSFVYAINCNSGAVDYDAIGEHFLRNDAANDNGGAVALVAATDLDYPLVSQRHLYTFMDEVLVQGVTRVGEAFYETSREEYATHAATTDLTSRWTLFSLILLGDPSLDLWTGLPQELSVTAPSSYEMGSGPLVVQVDESGSSTGVPGVFVTVYKDGEAHLVVPTDATGEAVLPFEPVTTGAYTVGVASPLHVPQVLTGNVTAPGATPHVVVTGCQLVELIGNGDGSADVGETAELTIELTNTGGAAAQDVTVDATELSPEIDVLAGAATVGTIDPGGNAFSTPILVSVTSALAPGLSYVNAEVQLDILAQNGAWSRTLPIRVGQPRLRHIWGLTTELAGDGDRDLEPGERFSVDVTVHNSGGGRLVQGLARLVSLDEAVIVVDEGVWSVDPLPGGSASPPAFTFDVVGFGAALVDVVYDDMMGEALRVSLDFDPPTAPPSVWSEGGEDYVRLNWEPTQIADVQGYNVYREVDARGTSWVRVNETPVVGGFYADLNLPALTSFRYQVAAVDSAGNEGGRTAPLQASTSPPATGGFPVDLTGAENRGAVTFADLDQDGGVQEAVVGSDYLYVVRGDGTEYLDGDSQPSTLGIFTKEGFEPGEPVRVFWTKPAVADIDLDGTMEIVVGHMESGRLYCFDTTGALEWGGASHDLGTNLWSSPALGNIDGDPELEVVLWSGASSGPFRAALCAFNHDGTEVANGDNNTNTNGVLAKSPTPGSAYNYGSVALYDVDHDGRDEIMAGERFGTDGLFYVLDVNPGPIPTVSIKTGWPYDPAGGGHQFTSSPALADADTDGEHEIYVVSRQGLHAMEWTGDVRPGYPKSYTPSTLLDFNDFLPSPAIGEFNGDGMLDVLHGWSGGRIYAYTAATGDPLPGFPLDIPIGGQDLNAAFFNGSLVNVDADPEAEFVIGTGGGDLYAINADGSIVGGFPYALGGAIFGAPAIADMDANGSVDIVFTGVTNTLVSLEMTGVPSTVSTSHWPQWRHDSRNSGVYRSGVTVGVESPDVPVLTRLLPNVPNPFNPRTTIRYDVGGPGRQPVRLTIFDVGGRRVSELVGGPQGPGAYSVVWDGTDDRGRRLGSGVYFYELRVGDLRTSRRMVLVE